MGGGDHLSALDVIRCVEALGGRLVLDNGQLKLRAPTPLPDELTAAIPEGALVFGSGARAYLHEFASGRFELGAGSLEIGRAEAVALLGLRLIRAGVRADPMAVVPRYYRLTEAEEKLSATGAKRPGSQGGGQRGAREAPCGGRTTAGSSGRNEVS